MYEALPAALRAWVAYQAEIMGLPDPDSFILNVVELIMWRSHCPLGTLAYCPLPNAT